MPALPNNIPPPRPAEDVLNADNAMASQALEEDLDINDDCNSKDDNFSIQGDNVQSNNDQEAEPIQAVSTSIEEDIEMAIQSDDEYDTPESREHHGLYSGPCFKTKLHNLIPLVFNSIIFNPFIMMNLPCLTSLMTFFMYKTDYSGIFPRCTLSSNHLPMN